MTGRRPAVARTGHMRGAVRGMDAAPGVPTDGFTASPRMNPTRVAAKHRKRNHAARDSPPDAGWNGSLRSARSRSHFDGLNRLP